MSPGTSILPPTTSRAPGVLGRGPDEVATEQSSKVSRCPPTLSRWTLSSCLPSYSRNKGKFFCPSLSYQGESKLSLPSHQREQAYQGTSGAKDDPQDSVACLDAFPVKQRTRGTAKVRRDEARPTERVPDDRGSYHVSTWIEARFPDLGGSPGAVL